MIWLIVIPILAYFIIYPGGRKVWLKRKKEILKNSDDSEMLED
ncbi:MAG: hypothetical protein ACI8ZM_005733, partial [Crocinitomix sp.]